MKRELFDIIIDIEDTQKRLNKHLERINTTRARIGVIPPRWVKEFKDEVRRLDALAVELERGNR